MSGHAPMCSKHDHHYPVGMCRMCVRERLAAAVRAERERVANRAVAIVQERTRDDVHRSGLGLATEIIAALWAEFGLTEER